MRPRASVSLEHAHFDPDLGHRLRKFEEREPFSAVQCCFRCSVKMEIAGAELPLRRSYSAST
jgi:hypothetical protein